MASLVLGITGRTKLGRREDLLRLFEAHLAVVADGVARPGTQGVPWHEEFAREA